MPSFHLSREQSHSVWNNSIEPALHVRSQDTVRMQIAEASGGQLSQNSTPADVRQLDFSHINPVTGPVYVEGAEPGDALVVDILSMEMETWGWTAIIPGFGLLADEFQEPHLRISRITSKYAELLPGLRVPLSPFIGTIGVAIAEAGEHSIVPPRAQGGNMDIRHMTPGSRLWLPVAVEGALLSVGDTHSAQGDGEVCGTAVETASEVTLRVNLVKNRPLTSPMVETHPRSLRSGHAWAVTGIASDLWEAARIATRHMIALISEKTGLSDEDAYMVASIAGDLKISEIVDAPNWVVSMHLDKEIFEGGL
ncbi:acetamidase [Sulfobacillus thermotolerans]|uniref:Acetamidase n=1 Tax=Sulfobacillus thermotolerans TaxID=338644 RepID=A0ABM6RRY9_9FIRM|nr:acetamidase [Sulfobacillus thermotolerans]